jgi:hypothetical protein
MEHQGVRVERLSWTDVEIAEIPLPNGVTVKVTLGVGSGLHRNPHHRSGIVWGVADRGPNLLVDQAVEYLALTELAHLLEIDGAKIQLEPDSGPAIVELRVDGTSVAAVRVLPLRLPDGSGATGRPNPLANAGGERTFDPTGREISPDPDGLDPEGIVALSDGSFRVVEEYAPSILVVDETGVVRERWVAASLGSALAGAKATVVPCLPSIAARRRLNRGFEGIALTPDESEILVVFQSALAHPDIDGFRANRWCRIWRLSANDGAFLAQYAYPLDKAHSFERDSAAGEVKQSDVKLCELVAIDGERVIVLERISHTAKLYEVKLSTEFETPLNFMDEAHRPALEEIDPETASRFGVVALEKRLLFSTDEVLDVAPDIEGMALLSKTELLLATDNDFGVTGAETSFWRVVLDRDTHGRST